MDGIMESNTVHLLSSTSQETWGSWGALGELWSLGKMLQVRLHFC